MQFAPFSLDAIWSVTTRVLPVEERAIDALEHTLATKVPAGYRELLARFGESPFDVCGGGFCGMLWIPTPDQLVAHNARLVRRDSSYFDGPWPNFDALFSRRETSQMLSFGHTFDMGELVHVRGRDEVFFFPNPRARNPEIAVTLSLVEAVGLYTRRIQLDVPFFQSGIAQASTALRARHMPENETWTEILSRLRPDRTDDESPALYFRRANARVGVQYDEVGLDYDLIEIDHDVAAEAFVDEVIACLRAAGAHVERADEDDDLC